MRRLQVVLPASLTLLAACGGKGDPCAGYDLPERRDTSTCADVDPSDPTALVECLRGSGHAGVWTTDADGLPAYDLTVEQRCDPAGQHEAYGEVLRDPVHLIGNGRGTVAVAHASGGVELYSQDRGHKWMNKIDRWRDPDDPDYPLQIGGGFNYVIVDGEIRSTRYEDIEIGEAEKRQTRRFGVGYVETVTTWKDLRVTRRVFAPESRARALVAEVKIENLTDEYLNVGLVEFWDLNVHQILAEDRVRDTDDPSLRAEVERRRRALMEEFEHTLSYSKTARAAVAKTRALATPEGVSGRGSVAGADYFPDPVYLALIDGGKLPDGVWLDDRELWEEPDDRSPPERLADEAGAEARELELSGAGQHGILAMRVQVSVPIQAPVERRFAFGYVPGGGLPDDDLAALRGAHGELRRETAASWKDRLVWAAIPGQEGAGAVQREVAWSSYAAQAAAVYDEYYDSRVAGPGGAYRFLHGVEGAIGELALIAESLAFVDADLARETLRYALSTQRGGMDVTPWRFPYATSGVGSYTDVGGNAQRSDAYFLLPAAVARYAALTRDFDFLEAKTPYWPLHMGEAGPVREHLARSLEYANLSLGKGARGLIAIGTSDYQDGVLSLAEGEATPLGASSALSAGFVAAGFPLVSDLVEDQDEELALGYRELWSTQAMALEGKAWSGEFFRRGFLDDGDPLASGSFFLEPQLFPILGGIIDEERRDQVLDRIADELDTELGAVRRAPVGGGEKSAGIWAEANAWLTEAYASRSPEEGWRSFVAGSLFRRAETYPDTWYGIWTGPEVYRGPDHERAGQVPLDDPVARGALPALSTHAHASTLRALFSLLGVTPTVEGLRIEPRMPTETFSVVYPQFELRSRPTEIAGALTAAGTGTLTLEVQLTSAMRSAGIAVTVKDGQAVEFSRQGETVLFDLPVREGERSSWTIRAL